MGSRSYGRSPYGGVLRTVGARLWAKPQSQRPRGPGRVGGVQRLLMFDRAAAGPADTAALRPVRFGAGPAGLVERRLRAMALHAFIQPFRVLRMARPVADRRSAACTRERLLLGWF